MIVVTIRMDRNTAVAIGLLYGTCHNRSQPEAQIIEGFSASG